MEPASSDPLAFVLIIGAVVAWIAFVALGQYVSYVNGRPASEAYVLAGVFGPFGVLILALLPTVKSEPIDPAAWLRGDRKRVAAPPAAEPAPIAFPGPARKSGPPRV